MNNKLVKLPILLTFMTLLACQEVPITGRRRLQLVPAQTINQLGIQTYQQFLDQAEVITSTEQSQMVQEVGNNIVNAVYEYFGQVDTSVTIPDYDWQFTLVQDQSVNAFALPGGKVVINSGIMEIAQDRAGLATIISHEVAHVVAGHGSERMSQGLLVQFGGMALSRALAERPAETRNLFLQSFGIGAQLGYLLPFSRLHETEADQLGLIFMAIGGYDPRESINFWQRMMAQNTAAPPEFLSTHPADQTRLENLRQFMPEALEYYNQPQ